MGRLYRLQPHTFTALVLLYRLFFKYNRSIFTLIRFPISLSTGPCICNSGRKVMDYKTRDDTSNIYTHQQEQQRRENVYQNERRTPSIYRRLKINNIAHARVLLVRPPSLDEIFSSASNNIYITYCVYSSLELY